MASVKFLMSSSWARVVVCRASENQLLTRLQTNVNRISAAGICHKDRMDPVIKAIKPKPWPYKEKQLNSWRWYIGESTIDRFDENTVMVTIEGLPGSGKAAFAKKFAEATDMLHKDKITFDFAYIRPDGLDYRMFNKVYYPEAQYPDIDLFLKNPKHPKMGRMQCDMYKLRFFSYVEAMAHLFNTGQGVVMERSPWSDQVFMEAMFECGYTNNEIYRYYLRVRHNTQIKLWRPHLVIYIDTPIETSLKNIKKRNNATEVSSPIWNTDFLKHIDDAYKNKVIPEFDEHSYVLVYPYKDDLDIDSILSDIEKMDFHVYLSNPKLCDWRIPTDDDFFEWRRQYTNDIKYVMSFFSAPTFDVDGYDYSNEAKDLHLQTELSLAPYYWPNFDPNKHSVWDLAFKRKNNYWESRAMGLFKAYDP